MGDEFPLRIFDVHLWPVLLVLEHDRGFNHVHRRRIGGGFGPANFAEDMVNFREGFNDLVSLLEDLPSFGRRDARKGGRHVQEIAFVKWRHEFGAEIFERENLADFFCQGS